MTKIPAKMTNE